MLNHSRRANGKICLNFCGLDVLTVERSPKARVFPGAGPLKSGNKAIILGEGNAKILAYSRQRSRLDLQLPTARPDDGDIV
jgi:hypothetical protein